MWRLTAGQHLPVKSARSDDQRTRTTSAHHVVLSCPSFKISLTYSHSLEVISPRIPRNVLVGLLFRPK